MIRPPEGSRIARLPPRLQRPARLVRALVPSRLLYRMPRAYSYRSDGIATAHYSPFLEDQAFNDAYAQVTDRWPEGSGDIRWRVWILTSCARTCRGLPGNLAEFGVYRGGCAFMVLSQAEPAEGQRLFLFDTFSGIPGSHLTAAEAEAGFERRMADTSEASVARLLRPFGDRARVVAGDVFHTLEDVETGPLAFAHLDLNAATATAAALDYTYARLVPTGMIVFDDYGWAGYDEQRAMIDSFFRSRPETVLALPTGQALVVKR